MERDQFEIGRQARRCGACAVDGVSVNPQKAAGEQGGLEPVGPVALPVGDQVGAATVATSYPQCVLRVVLHPDEAVSRPDLGLEGEQRSVDRDDGEPGRQNCGRRSVGPQLKIAGPGPEEPPPVATDRMATGPDGSATARVAVIVAGATTEEATTDVVELLGETRLVSVIGTDIEGEEIVDCEAACANGAEEVGEAFGPDAGEAVLVDVCTTLVGPGCNTVDSDV